MKKRCVLFILALFLGCGGLIATHGVLSAQADDVVLTEHTLYGDRAAADGITMTQKTQMNYRLFWDTTCTLGSTPDISTKFHFFPAQQDDFSDDYTVELENVIGYSVYGDIDSRDSLDDALYCYWDVIEAVASRAPNDSTKYREVVSLNEYLDCIPIHVNLHLKRDVDIYWDNLRELDQRLTEAFHIPFPEDCVAEIQLRKNADGTISELDFNVIHDPNLFLSSAVTEDACYIIPYGEGVLNGDFPMGYGVFRFPYQIDSSSEALTVNADQLSLFFPVPKDTINLDQLGTSALKLMLSSDQQKMFIPWFDTFSDTSDTLGGNFANYLSVLNLKTGQEEQILQLPFQDNRTLWKSYIGEDFIVLIDTSANGVVLENTDGVWKNVLEFSISEEIIKELNVSGNDWTSPILVDDCVMAWNGRQLAILSGNQYNDQTVPSDCTLYLSVFGTNGLEYCGRYDSSLDARDQIPYGDSDYMPCSPVNVNPLSVTWSDS